MKYFSWPFFHDDDATGEFSPNFHYENKWSSQLKVISWVIDFIQQKAF